MTLGCGMRLPCSSRAGALVDVATSAATARDQLAARIPTVIVCDIAMPGEDGFSFIRKLRATGSDLPAIALTAHAMASDADRAFAAGFDRHLAKPIDFEHLVASLRDVLAARSPSGTT
jgi:CheY-like chemotaxis protein